MTDAATIETEIIALLAQWSAIREPITPRSAIYHDLRLYGDDAYELLTEVSKRYSVSFSGFVFSAYFPGEGFLGNFWAWRAKNKWKRLTVGHLAAVAECGSWFEP